MRLRVGLRRLTLTCRVPAGDRLRLRVRQRCLTLTGRDPAGAVGPRRSGPTCPLPPLSPLLGALCPASRPVNLTLTCQMGTAVAGGDPGGAVGEAGPSGEDTEILEDSILSSAN